MALLEMLATANPLPRMAMIQLPRDCEEVTVAFGITVTCNRLEGHKGKHIDMLNTRDGIEAIITWDTPSDPVRYPANTSVEGSPAQD